MARIARHGSDVLALWLGRLALVCATALSLLAAMTAPPAGAAAGSS